MAFPPNAPQPGPAPEPTPKSRTRGKATSRRAFAAGSALGLWSCGAAFAQAPDDVVGPVEAPFERDYDAPGFKPSWKKQQLNRTLVQDFVIFGHSDLNMTRKLLDREPALIHATMDWGGGDWESALGGASHMGRHDIVEMLLDRGARIDLFCAAMMGQLEAIKSYLTLQPKLIDAKGPHGFSLHFHAQVGAERSLAVLDYLQSIKEVELRPIPFLKKNS